jgi:glycine hydroxymethyltransferase
VSPGLAPRAWVPEASEALVAEVAAAVAGAAPQDAVAEVERLAEENRRIHDVECVNLNPAANVMSPRAEAVLAAGLGSRPSLGYPGAKYEMGLEAVERIEVVAAELAAEVFRARHAEVRVGSGALANLYAFMATCRPGDAVVVPPASIGGHITHHDAGAAGLYGLRVVPAPVRADGYTVDVDALAAVVREVRPALVTVGGSLNLWPHPVADVRALADEVGARVLFDAAHLCGLIAGGVWPDPLAEGAHLMTMSTYKSLGGPAGGLLVTDDAGLAERVDAIAYPGLTANFDAGRVAALAITMADWKAAGAAYAQAMQATARRLADELVALDVPVFARERGGTSSHQLAVEAAPWGGGQAAAARLRAAGLLTCGIGLPLPPVDGDVNGLRLGTPEVVRRGAEPDDMPVLAAFVAAALAPGADLPAIAGEVAAWRRPLTRVRYTVDDPA